MVQILGITRNIYKEDDLKITVPTDEVEGLVGQISGIIDLKRTYDSFKAYGIGTLYHTDKVPGKVPVEVEMSRSNGESTVRFTHINEEGYQKLLEIATVLGIELQPSKPTP